MNEDIMFGTIILISLIVCFISGQAWSQAGPIAIDEFSDVIDHTSFDSLWRESIGRGKLRTDGCQSPAYVRYRSELAAAKPSAFLPRAVTAFWVNAYLACLMEVMHIRAGYRSTVWDSLWLSRDTFMIAGHLLTLNDMVNEARRGSGTPGVFSCLPNGSSKGAPFPSSVATAKTVKRLIRDQMRRICRSERYLLYDPAGNVLQLTSIFTPMLTEMSSEAESIQSWVLPYVTEAVAAQMALRASTLKVTIQDGIESWRKARPP